MKFIRQFSSLPLTLGVMAMPCLATSAVRAESMPKSVERFVSEYCSDCHDDSVSKGNLNLADMNFDLGGHAGFETWKRVYDRVLADEMPPQKKSRPAANEKAAFLSQLKGRLTAADQKQKEVKGRVNVRRLTRREYEHTIHDLLGVDMPLQELLPEDPSTHGFETVATGQQLSHHNLRRYLDAADIVLNNAFVRATMGESSFETRVSASQMAHKRGGNYRGPQLLDEVCHFWPMTLQFYGRMSATSIRSSGWYSVTLRDVRAINPKNDAVWGTLRSGTCSSSSPILYPVGIVEATKEKRDLTFTAWIRRGHMLELKPNDATLKRARSGASGGNVAYQTGRSLTKERLQGIEVGRIDIKRIYPNSTRDEMRAKLFGGLTKADIAQLRNKSVRRKVCEKVVTHFANRAFRRPVTPEQVSPYVNLALEALDNPEKRPKDAIRTAYRAILCSPRFLTFVEKPGQLDDHALASRLSYALWNSMPDDELRTLADRGKLRDFSTFHAQLDRLIDDAKADRFIASFADQWLNLKEIDFTTPDRRMYRTFDQVVKSSMVDETRAFLKELIVGNRPIHNLIHSEFGMLNERLERFYGMRDLGLKPGAGVQKVSLGDRPRGGLITQGAVLKVTANGTTTSPVVRGVWVSERILGLEIPPPPANVPAVEPDIRGAVSIRDQLAKHRDNESCATCHRNIDPAGFALEQFDPVGLVRSRYGTRGDSARVDGSGVTPSGEEFENIRGWKKIYLKKPALLTEAFAKHLLTYATGAPLRFSDRDTLSQIVDQARDKGFRMRSILHAALGSNIFDTK
jgi:hypothetical protein